MAGEQLGHDTYETLMRNFLDCLDQAIRDREDANSPVSILLGPDAATGLSAVLRRTLQAPYLTPDMVLHCQKVNELMREGIKLGQDSPTRFDPASVMGRMIALSAALAESAKTGTVMAVERHEVLEHIARSWWTALDSALEENASRHAIAARRALSNMHADDQLEVRERMSQLLCLPGTGGDYPYGRVN